jgi:zinc transport system substrate-binding protein
MLKKIFVICALILAAACGKTSAPSVEKKPLLLVSIAPYRFLAEKIAGDDFEVTTVVPVAANPHSFEPTARQVQEISRGVVWFRIGEAFETKVLPILEKRSAGLVVQDLRDGIELIEDCHMGCSKCSMDHLDRHIWLSPKLAGQQAGLIAKTLGEKFPEKKELFEANLQKLQFELVALDSELHAILKDVKKRTILVSHPAFAYFCREYGLKQLSIEYEGKEPRPKHLEEILKQAVTESMDIALALPQHNNKGAQMIAERLHMSVRLIDPYSPKYFETMRELARLIAEPHGN